MIRFRPFHLVPIDGFFVKNVITLSTGGDRKQFDVDQQNGCVTISDPAWRQFTGLALGVPLYDNTGRALGLDHDFAVVNGELFAK